MVLGVHAELAFDDFDRLGEEKGFVHEEIVNKWSELRAMWMASILTYPGLVGSWNAAAKFWVRVRSKLLNSTLG